VHLLKTLKKIKTFCAFHTKYSKHIGWLILSQSIHIFYFIFSFPAAIFGCHHSSSLMGKETHKNSLITLNAHNEFPPNIS
jgi:hypothetical protein